MFLLAIPKLISAAFRFSQPVLINRTIAYVTEPVTEFGDGLQSLNGTQLIFAAIIVYSGTTVGDS
jgi:ATP-binding cassette, subfamily C (CFTR/MRP), member 1